jgi:hypothetical protein
MRDPMEILESVLSRFPRPWRAYLRWNFCKALDADGAPKPASRLYDLYAAVFYLRCPCCAALRGLALGFLLGLLCKAVLP